MKPTKEELENLYWGKQLSTVAIGHQLGVMHQYVAFLLEKYGIPKRSQSEAARLSYKEGRKKPIRYYGENHPSWKGGRYKDIRGYILVRNARNKNGYVYEHILEWEKANGKLLPSNWTVHHLNGIKDDNRPENLIGLPRKGHGTFSRVLLSETRKRIRKLEADIKALKTQGAFGVLDRGTK